MFEPPVPYALHSDTVVGPPSRRDGAQPIHTGMHQNKTERAIVRQKVAAACLAALLLWATVPGLAVAGGSVAGAYNGPVPAQNQPFLPAQNEPTPISPVQNAPGPDPTVETGPVPPTPGTTATVPVRTDTDGVTGFWVQFAYDPTAVAVTNVTVPGFERQAVAVDASVGTVTIAAVAPAGSTVSDGAPTELATVELVRTDPAAETLARLQTTASPVVVTDDPLRASTELATVAFTDRTPGDLTGDGTVSAADATLLQQYLTDAEAAPIDRAVAETVGDVTQDGSVTTADVVRILQIAIDPDIPPPEPGERQRLTQTTLPDPKTAP